MFSIKPKAMDHPLDRKDQCRNGEEMQIGTKSTLISNIYHLLNILYVSSSILEEVETLPFYHPARQA
jgi:hypothetical protein